MYAPVIRGVRRSALQKVILKMLVILVPGVPLIEVARHEKRMDDKRLRTLTREIISVSI